MTSTAPAQPREQVPDHSTREPGNLGVEGAWSVLSGSRALLVGLLGLSFTLGWPALVSLWGRDPVVPLLESPSILFFGGILWFGLLGLALRLLFALISPAIPEEGTHTCFKRLSLPKEFFAEDWQSQFASASAHPWNKASTGLRLEKTRWGGWGRLFVLVSLLVLGATLVLDLFLSTGWLWSRVARLLSPWLLFGFLAQLWSPHAELNLVRQDHALILFGRSLDGAHGTLRQQVEAFESEWETWMQQDQRWRESSVEASTEESP